MSVVVCWNNVDLLPECIESLKSQTYRDHSIVVVDNDSNDDSVKYLADVHPDVTVIPLDWNSGFAHANNVGIRKAFEDPDVGFVAFVNSDALLSLGANQRGGILYLAYNTFQPATKEQVLVRSHR